MSAPLCPLLMQARASLPELQWEHCEFNDGVAAAAPTKGPLYADPSAAPGVACIGSRCAWWDAFPADKTIGRCGQVRGQNFADPAKGAA